MENSISLRNIPRVNYTGMDTIEPVDEFDGITDIWFDTTIEEDSDYEYEEEEDDEEEVEDRRKWAKIHPELITEEKDDLKQNLSQTVEHHRVRRNIKRVNYAGMDMTEEDEGSVYVCETKWKDRIPTYSWIKYPASQANELGDEEWTIYMG
jgi:hypothetical protein